MTYCPAASLYASLGHEAAKKNGLHCAPVNCAGPALGEMVAGLVLEHKDADPLFRLARFGK